MLVIYSSSDNYVDIAWGCSRNYDISQKDPPGCLELRERSGKRPPEGDFQSAIGWC